MLVCSCCHVHPDDCQFKEVARCGRISDTSGDPCTNPVARPGVLCIYCYEFEQLCAQHDKLICATCNHYEHEHGGITGASECMGADASGRYASCPCSRFVSSVPAAPPLPLPKLPADVQKRAEAAEERYQVFSRKTLEKAQQPNPSPVVAVVAVHEDGSYTLLDERPAKPTKRIILYVDERNEFGKQAMQWFQDVPVIRIPMSGGLPFAVVGKARYEWHNDELKTFACTLAPRVFKRSDTNPESGIAYETCAVCGKHIRHHYGSADRGAPTYRCDPAY